MGYELVARNNIPELHVPLWGLVLEIAGFLFPFIQGRTGEYFALGKYVKLIYNDKFWIKSGEAKIWANMIENYVAIGQKLHSEYFPESNRLNKLDKDIPYLIGRVQQLGPHDGDDLLKVAEFMRKSGGFRIH
jgi:hypothetical protein